MQPVHSFNKCLGRSDHVLGTGIQQRPKQTKIPYPLEIARPHLDALNENLWS
jgi:hypothetical protein